MNRHRATWSLLTFPKNFLISPRSMAEEERTTETATQNSNTHRGLILLFSPFLRHLPRCVWKHCCGIYMSRNIGCISRLHRRKDRLDTSTCCCHTSQYRARRVLCTPLAKRRSIPPFLSLLHSLPNFSYLVDALPTHPQRAIFHFSIRFREDDPRFSKGRSSVRVKGGRDTGEVAFSFFFFSSLLLWYLRFVWRFVVKE